MESRILKIIDFLCDIHMVHTSHENQESSEISINGFFFSLESPLFKKNNIFEIHGQLAKTTPRLPRPEKNTTLNFNA